MSSLSSAVGYILLFYVVFIVSLYLLVKTVKRIRANRTRKNIENTIEEGWDRARKMREMNAIEQESFQALGHVRIFLNDLELKYQYLKEEVVPEFNQQVSADERIPTDLPEKKLRKLIQKKAEEYYDTFNPLLMVLAESFVAKMRRELGQKKK